MTTVDCRARTADQTDIRPSTEPMSSRIRRAAPLAVGAALVLLLLEPIGTLPTRGWVPILIGLPYVAAGLLSGRRGILLGPGLVIAAWGVAPMATNYDYDFPGMFYLTLGTGLLLAGLTTVLAVLLLTWALTELRPQAAADEA